MSKKPSYFTNLAVLIIFILLLLLGSWQLYRLAWKNKLIDQIEHFTDQPYVELPNEINHYKNFLYHKVKTKGHFEHHKEIHLFAGSRSYKSGPGYLIITPLRLLNNSYILINRGWVSEAEKNIKNRLATINGELVEIEGYLIESEQKSWLTFDNDLQKNVWLWLDIEAIREFTKLSLPSYILVQNYQKNISPVGRDLVANNIRNDHLAYAITWFGAAISLLVIYIIIFIKHKNIKVSKLDE